MDQISYSEIQTIIRNKINSLKNDFSRAYWNLDEHNIQMSPFPIIMYALSIIDLFSSYEAGWNSKKGKNQTDRMVNFCTNRLKYKERASKILIQMHRHQLMHTSEPRLIVDKDTNIFYGWSVNRSDPNHMKVIEYPTVGESYTTCYLHLGMCELIKDIEDASEEYIRELHADVALQANFISCIEEIFAKSAKDIKIPTQ